MDKWLKTVRSKLAFPGLTGLTGENAFHNKIKQEYNSLFEGPIAPFVSPVESIYKPWDKSGGSVLGEGEGYVMGDPALDMARRYATAGMEIPPEYSHKPDHIALVLEYMAFAVERLSEADQLMFLNEHLNWIGNLFNDIKSNKNGMQFIKITRFLEAFIREDSARLEGAR